MELSANTGIKKLAIELVKSKQPIYGSIYSLRPIKLEILKTYIKIYLKTRFIHLSRSLAKAPILFDNKRDNSFCLYFNYQALNNLTIKNNYPLSLIAESLKRP